MKATEEQQRVIDCNNGNYFVDAGPGSGKTASIIQRIVRLLKNDVHISNILGITFTNKAANEMKDRLIAALPILKKKDINIFTFHSFAHSLLKAHGSAIGLQPYTIMGDDESKKTITNISRKHSIKSPDEAGEGAYPEILAEEIPILKTKTSILHRVLDRLESIPGLTIASAVGKTKHNLIDEDVVTFCSRCTEDYIGYKNKENKLDFSDLQPFCIKLLKAMPDLGKQYHYISIDEAQDCAPVNIELVSLINKYNNVMAVGNVAQSIYQFRGASATAVKDFITKFSAKELFLTKNFRSVANIVHFANESINRVEAKMESNNQENGMLYYKEFAHHDEEVEAIVSKIQLLKGL